MIGFRSQNSKYVLVAIGVFLAGRLLETASPIAGDVVSAVGALAMIAFAVRVVRDFQKLNHG